LTLRDVVIGRAKAVAWIRFRRSGGPAAIVKLRGFLIKAEKVLASIGISTVLKIYI
jgi:hypothetical protein